MSRDDFYKHYLWKRHEHPHALHQSLPELITTDGDVVRRIVSQRRYIYFQAFHDQETCQQITGRVEASVSAGTALGYAMFADSAAVAILNLGEGERSSWIAYPHKRIDNSVIPTLPLSVADFPQLRLVAGAALEETAHRTRVLVALEQRGEAFQSSDFAMNIMQYVEEMKLMAQFGVGAESREIRLVDKKGEFDFSRVSSERIELKIPVHQTIVREFSQKESFSVWMRVQFNRELISLPEEWRRFWLGLDVPGLTA